jgi:hypothetical protein
MERILTVAMFGAVALGSLVWGQETVAQSGPLGSTASAVKSENRATGNLADVPPLPRGKSTIMGGQIRDIDQVRDQFVLHVYGEKPMKILYDGRTQLFKDGNKISLLELSPAEHASVQTTLDGSKIFALSVHILTASPKGAYEGRILSYDATSGMMVLSGAGTQGLFRVRVTRDTAVKREGQSSFTAENRGQFDLVQGALVTLNFQSDSKGQGTAQEITILATPGASFVFTGTVAALNVAGGYLTVVDPRDQRSYQIYFNPQDPVVLKLHEGDRVRIAADYDGTRYAATHFSQP